MVIAAARGGATIASTAGKHQDTENQNGFSHIPYLSTFFV
jgi:hypothetical protein